MVGEAGAATSAAALVDFNEMPKVNRFYGGNAGRKICIEYLGAPWMLKYPASTAQLAGRVASYTSSPVSEYIGSHVYGLLGIPVHDTVLGFRDGKVVVACRDFTYPDKTLLEFRMLRNSISDDSASFSNRPSDGSTVTLSDVLESISQLDDVYDSEKVRERFWDMFVTDAFIGNKDRNNGNWGLLARNGAIEGLAPVYDERELLLGPVLLRERPPLWRDLLERRERLLHGAISSMEQAKTPVDGNQLALYRRELSYVRQALEKFH